MDFLTIFLFLSLIITLLFIAVYIFFKYSYTYWEKRNIPYVPPEFIYGSMKNTIQLKMTQGEEIMQWYTEYKRNNIKHFGAYLFHKAIFIAADPEFLKRVMIKDFEYFSDRGVYCNEDSDPLSTHLFSLEGHKWKNLRKKLTPSFTSGKIKQMFQTLLQCTEELANCLDESIKKSEPTDIKKVLVQYTTDVIGSCAFGLDCNSFKNPDSDFIRIGEKIFNPDVFYKSKAFFAFLFPFIAKLLKLRVTNKDVDHFFRNLVKDTIQYREKNNISRNDFMQLLIQLKNNVMKDDEGISQTVGTSLTLDEASAQAFLFFIAGFETSSTTMTFCLYELAQNPDIQEKARTEIVDVLKKYDGKITYDALMEMQLMEKIILESMRKHPAVMALQRRVTQDYKVPGLDLVLEKNILVFIPVLALHYDPEFYPEPEKFDPERFTEENKATRPDCTFLPFGEGPRICIGLRFGMMQTKVGLCRLLCNYRFSPNYKTSNPLKIDPNSLVRSVIDGIWLNAEKIS